MTKYHLIASAAVLVLGSSSAFGFARFARGEAVLSTTARASYDSRIFGGYDSADDYIFTLDPRVIYRREAGQVKLESNVGMRFNRYYEFDELNSEDLLASLKLQLPPGGSTRSSGLFETSYSENTDVNYDVNRRVREKTFLNRLSADIPTGLKTVLLLGGSFRREKRDEFSDRDTWDGSAGFRYQNFLGGSSFDVRYRHLELESTGNDPTDIPLEQSSDIYSATFTRPLYHDLRGSFTYGYRILDRSQREVLDGSDPRSAGSLFGINLTGPFLPKAMFPKLDTSLSLGYQKSETPGLNDRNASRFVGAMNINWQARERSRITFNVRRALELSVNNFTVETTGVTVGLTQAVGNFITTSFSTGYEQRDYGILGRNDDVYIAQASGRYSISRTWSTSATYSLRQSNSSVAIADYGRHYASLEINYTF